MARSFEVEAMVRGYHRTSGTLILQLRDVSWVNISWFASLPRKPRKYYPSKITGYTVYSAFNGGNLVVKEAAVISAVLAAIDATGRTSATGQYKLHNHPLAA